MITSRILGLNMAWGTGHGAWGLVLGVIIHTVTYFKPHAPCAMHHAKLDAKAY
jgi:hypothetical protein